MADHQIFCLGSHDGKAIKIASAGSEIDPILQSDHEEADSHILVHCEHFSKASHGRKRVIILSPDKDVAVLSCHHFAALNLEEFIISLTGKTEKVYSYTFNSDKPWTQVV